MKNNLPLAYVAVDTPDIDRAIFLAEEVGNAFKGIKLGLEFFMSHGPDGVKRVMDALGDDVSLFLDLKLHDIPNTVAGSLRAVSNLGADYITVHAAGGADMIKASVEALSDVDTQILCVTVLTSLSEIDVAAFSSNSLPETALSLAKNAFAAGGHGLVCSAHEVKLLRAEFGQDIVLMVPGIRQSSGADGDQKRVMTAEQAMNAGATHLVIGRAVTQAVDPKRAAEDIMQSILTTKAA
jgi:orotidine-5'-phosphate decarboxylase